MLQEERDSVNTLTDCSLKMERTLTYQVVALRLKGVCSANIEALSVYSLEHPDVVETVRLQRDRQRGFIRLQTESEAAHPMRTCLYLFGFPF